MYQPKLRTPRGMSPAIINLKPSKTYIPANSLCYEKKKQHTLHTLTHSPNRKTSTFAATTHFMPTSPKDIFNIPIRYKVYIYIFLYTLYSYKPDTCTVYLSLFQHIERHACHDPTIHSPSFLNFPILSPSLQLFVFPSEASLH